MKDVDECASSSSNNCHQVCNNNDGSYSCSCNAGYRLNGDGRTCGGKWGCIIFGGGNGYNISDTLNKQSVDINECAEGTDMCAQNCRNTVGSYTCSCNTGYTLSSNQHGCLSKSTQHACTVRKIDIAMTVCYD